jgi:transcription elongation GreA/GreB family factor
LTREIKKSLLAQIVGKLETELNALRASAAAAHDAATHAENKPENQYDTRGLEASYLAGAQDARATELQSALDLIRATLPQDFRTDQPVGLSAVVELTNEQTIVRYFIVQVAGGYSLKSPEGQVLTITPQTPLGRALIGKRVGDEILVQISKGDRAYELTHLF